MDYQNGDPFRPCTLGGENAYTHEPDFGEAYGYNLDYQSDPMRLSGYVSVENYYDYMNCYVEVIANQDCNVIEISLTSLAMEIRRYNNCTIDVAYLSNLEGNFKSERLCGCYGDGCSVWLWGRNVTDPWNGYVYAYYFNDGPKFNYGGEYNYTYMEEYWTSGIWEDTTTSDNHPVADKWRIPGSGFRLNIQSDVSISHGEIKLEWTCVDGTPTNTTSSSSSFFSQVLILK